MWMAVCWWVAQASVPGGAGVAGASVGAPNSQAARGDAPSASDAGVADMAASAADAGVANFHFPIEIISDRLQVQGKLKQATWYGHVHATRGPTRLVCDKLVAHYWNGEEIRTMECLGNVEVEDGNKWAHGDRADFDNVTGIIIVTGHPPEAREGRNYMKGSRIIFDVTHDTLEVEKPNSIFETKGGAPALPRTPAEKTPASSKPSP